MKNFQTEEFLFLKIIKIKRIQRKKFQVLHT